MIEAARGVLNKFVADTYVFSDVSAAAFVPQPSKENPAQKRKTGLGFGISLVAESSTGCLYSADRASPPEGGVPPEDMGTECARMLLESVEKGGCVSVEAVETVVTLMAMGSEDVGRVQLGRDVLGSEQVVQMARDLVRFGAAGWGIRDADGGEKSEGELVVSVVGRGIGNVGRKIG